MNRTQLNGAAVLPKQEIQQRLAARGKARLPVFTLEEKEAILNDWLNSGLSGREYSKGKGLAQHMLWGWKCSARKRGVALGVKVYRAPIAKPEPTEPNYQLNVCPNCGCPLKHINLYE
jgi:hypothetical protein